MQDILALIEPLANAGLAIHWLHPREKRPIGDDWSTKPRASFDSLRRRYIPGNNVGARLGEPSQVGDYFLHVLDIDVRGPEHAAAAYAAIDAMFPGVRETFPSVISGSGGASRHIYFFTDRPFSSTKLVRSPESNMVFDKRKGREVRQRHWEVELFGTGKQVAMPPSIHPDTGQPYVWERPLDLTMFDLGDVPLISAEALESAGGHQEQEQPVEGRPRLGLTLEQAEAILSELPLDYWCEDRDGWLQTGMALHHEFGEEGYDLWEEFSRKSEKFDEKNQRTVWKSFREKPRSIRMATLKSAANSARIQNAFEEAPDDDEPEATQTVQAATVDDELALLGGGELSSGIDDELALLGGDEESEDDEDPIIRDLLTPSGNNLQWVNLLAYNEEGTLKATLHNLELIVANDIWLRGMPAYNQFTQEVVQRGNPGIKKPKRDTAAKPTRQLSADYMQVQDPQNGDLWTEAKDNALRSVLESPETQGGYGIKVSDRDLRAAIDLTARKNQFHPVREYLSGLKWDGVRRVEELFIRYLGADDNVYNRSIGRLMMSAAVTRAFEPGHKFDFAVILEGLQGRRKSTFISTLAKGWFAELDGDFSDAKVMVEQMQGAWVLEIPELSGFGRADVRHIKAIVSRQVDKVRLAYAKRAEEFPRQCIFIGSTNDQEYLRDDTGGRRFWPVRCEVDEIDIEHLAAVVDQLWAEAFVMYQKMRAAQPFGSLPLYLTDTKAKILAEGLQESRRIESSDDALAGQIRDWLDRPIYEGSIDDDEGPRTRDTICLLQIWVEMMNGDRRSYTQVNAQTIGRAMLKLSDKWEKGSRASFPAPYGQQRAYIRKNSAAWYAEMEQARQV